MTMVHPRPAVGAMCAGLALTIAVAAVPFAGRSVLADHIQNGYPEYKDNLLMRFSTDGRVKQLWSIPLGADKNVQPGEARGVHCIAQDSKGNLYVGDIYGERAQKFVPVTDWPANERPATK